MKKKREQRNRIFGSHFFIWTFALLCCLARPSAPAQSPSPVAAGEAFRIRIQNTRYGDIAFSPDGGAHYYLLGRVLRPAMELTNEPGAEQAGAVLRSGPAGIALAILPGRTLKLLPRAGSGPSRRALKGIHTASPSASVSGLQTDFAAGTGLFAELLPALSSVVRLEKEPGALAAFPEGYAPRDGDTLVIRAALPADTPLPGAPEAAHSQRTVDFRLEIRRKIQALAARYEEEAVSRALRERRTVVTGYLTLQPKLPTGEPDPVTIVTYVVDGEVAAAQNVQPFLYRWDTRQAADGEHVVEIRGLSAQARLVTRAVALVVVANHRAAAP